MGSREVSSTDGSTSVCIDVISTTGTMLPCEAIFDFSSLKNLIARPDFRFTYDCMHGVQGPAHAHLQYSLTHLELLRVLLSMRLQKDDFAGHHADPNLTYARDLCDIMGVDREGTYHRPSNLGRPVSERLLMVMLIAI